MGTMPLSDLLYYDESSPTCLRWKVEIRSGRDGNQQNTYPGMVAGSPGVRKFHFVVTVNSVQVLAHHAVWELFNGPVKDGYVIDHENGDDKDNRISNLREVLQAANMRNCKRRTDNKTGVTGVSTRLSRHGTRQYTAQWRELDTGKQRSKTFTGPGAFEGACTLRAAKIAELNEQGAGYTERHGQKSSQG